MQIIIKLKVSVISDDFRGGLLPLRKMKSNSNFRHGIEWKLILLENAGDGGLKGAYFAPENCLFVDPCVGYIFSRTAFSQFSKCLLFSGSCMRQKAGRV